MPALEATLYDASRLFLIPVMLLIFAALAYSLNPLNPFQSQNVMVVENPGKDNMTITIKDGEKLERYTSTDQMGEGGGVKAGVTYRLPDGNLVYVPE